MSIIVDSGLALSLAVTIAAAALYREPAAGQQNPEEVHRARMKDGLRGAAKAAGGHYVSSEGWDVDFSFDSFEAIAKNSEVVLIGDIVANRSNLSSRGDYITTDYRLMVRESLKGGVPPLSEVVFQVMGGQVHFEDGTSATLETLGFVKPNNGDRVVIFGKQVPRESGRVSKGTAAFAGDAPVYNLVQLGRGVIEIPVNEDDKVRVKARGADDPLMRSTRSKSAKQFLHDLRKSVRKAEKEPGKVDDRFAIRHH